MTDAYHSPYQESFHNLVNPPRAGYTIPSTPHPARRPYRTTADPWPQDGAWHLLGAHPVAMPLWFGLALEPAAGQTRLRVTLGATHLAATQTQLHDVTVAGEWGAVWLQLELAGRPAAGVWDTLYVGGVAR